MRWRACSSRRHWQQRRCTWRHGRGGRRRRAGHRADLLRWTGVHGGRAGAGAGRARRLVEHSGRGVHGALRDKRRVIYPIHPGAPRRGRGRRLLGLGPPVRALLPGRWRAPASPMLPPPAGAVAVLLELPPVYRVEPVLVHQSDATSRSPRRAFRRPLRPLPGQSALRRPVRMVPIPVPGRQLLLLRAPEEDEEYEPRDREAAQRRAHHGHGDVAALHGRRRRRRHGPRGGGRS
jgi:hypothetical protein